MTGKLFLIVEDHPDVADRNCEFLKKISPNATCIVVANPQEAMARLSLEQFDLIVIDLMYKDAGGKQSGQSGLDLIKHILTNHFQLSILVYTSEPSLLQNIILQAQNHQSGFVIADKQQPRRDFMNKANILLENRDVKLIPNTFLPKEKIPIVLTPEEQRILILACEKCLTDQLIADQTCLGKKTIQNRMKSIRDKLGIYTTKSDTDLRMLMCNLARQKGLI